MSDYKIITDSTSDLSVELIAEMDVHVIPMHFTVDGKDYVNYPDERGLSARKFYDMLRAGKEASTSLLNAEYFKEQVRPFLDEGLDILYLCFSSALSASYNSVLMAKPELEEEYPGRKVIIVDTLAASLGEGLIVYHAVQRKKEGLSLEDVAKWTEENKLRIAHWFTVDDLHHLKRGGRLSGAAAMVGTMLNIKPVLHVDSEGRLMPVDKIRSRKKSLEALVTRMENMAIDPQNQTIFICHGDVLEDAKYVEKLVRERMNVKNIYINDIGPVIGAHAGPGTVALFFYANER